MTPSAAPREINSPPQQLGDIGTDLAALCHRCNPPQCMPCTSLCPPPPPPLTSPHPPLLQPPRSLQLGGTGTDLAAQCHPWSLADCSVFCYCYPSLQLSTPTPSTGLNLPVLPLPPHPWQFAARRHRHRPGGPVPPLVSGGAPLPGAQGFTVSCPVRDGQYITGAGEGGTGLPGVAAARYR